jgi:hypothetical protein
MLEERVVLKVMNFQALTMKMVAVFKADIQGTVLIVKSQ